MVGGDGTFMNTPEDMASYSTYKLTVVEMAPAG